jgi:putative flippase GtrA
MHYNLPYCPPYIQFLAYLFVGGAAAIVNLFAFLFFYSFGMTLAIAAPIAFVLAAAVNYLLSVTFVFRHNAKWGNILEISLYCIVVLAGAALDLFFTKLFITAGSLPALAKIMATAVVLMVNFIGRRYIVFPLAGRADWRPRNQG